MNELGVLRSYLSRHFPRSLREEQQCTCGASNHVRVRPFRVDGQPAIAIILEGAWLTADDLRETLRCARVEPIEEAEFDEIFVETELGRTQPFENPFGATVYLDESVLAQPEIVFCPRMFFSLVRGRAGQRHRECFRIPTQELLALARAIVLPLTPKCPAEPDYWAV